MKIIIPKYTSIVKKSESLVNASFDLNEIALKLITTLISSIKEGDKDSEIYILPVKDFKDLLKVESNNFSYLIDEATSQILQSHIKIKNGDGSFETFSWVTRILYKSSDGTLEFDIQPKLRPHLLQLSENFLKYEIKNILSLKSSYVIRLYEKLKFELKDKNEIDFQMSLKDLREVFEVPNSYQYSGIKQRILEKAQQQFEEKTDIVFDFKEIKLSKNAVTHLIFTISKNKGFKGD